MNEAHRYRSLPLDEEAKRKEHSMDINKSEDRKKPELSQNVRSLPLCSVAFCSCGIINEVITL
jgi:hypothetical protein